MFSEISPRLAVASAYDPLPPGWQLLDVRGMIDGPGNSPDLVEDYIVEGVRLLDVPDSRLLVICDYGQSRSNFIAAQVYARTESVSLDRAMAIVASAHRDSKIKPSLLAVVEKPVDLPLIRRIAVTGGQGFVGRRLCEELTRRGMTCLPLTRTKHGDYLTSSDSLRSVVGPFDPDLLVHLAHPKPYNAENSSQVALAQLISVAAFCEESQVSLGYPSSWVVFDGATDEEVTSDSARAPHSRYGRLKAMIEVYLLDGAKQGLSVRIVRLPGMYGVDSLEPRFLRYFAECAAKGEEIVYHQFENGSARVPLVPVEACVSAFATALTKFHDLSLVSHLGSRETSPSVQEIVARLAESTGVRAKATPVQRKAFTGGFVPEITLPSDESIAAGIHEFILQLGGEFHGKKKRS